MLYGELSPDTLRVVLAIDNAINQGFHGVSQPTDGNYLDTFWQIGREYAAALEVLESRGLRPVAGADVVPPTASDECETLAMRLEKIAQRRFVRLNSQVLTMAETATMNRCADLLRLIPGLLEVQAQADACRLVQRAEAMPLTPLDGPAIDVPLLTEVVTLRVGTLGWFASLAAEDRLSAYHLVCAGQAMRAKQSEDASQWQVVFTGTSMVVGKFPDMAEACAFAEAWNCSRLAPHQLPPLSEVMALNSAPSPASRVLPSSMNVADGAMSAAPTSVAFH